MLLPNQWLQRSGPPSIVHEYKLLYSSLYSPQFTCFIGWHIVNRQMMLLRHQCYVASGYILLPNQWLQWPDPASPPIVHEFKLL